MKKVLVFSSIGFLLAAVLALWRMHGAASAGLGPSLSQIYIHDTPVCVMQQGGRIVAMVGECDDIESPRDFLENSPGRPPFHGAPGPDLPPGHPPIPPGMAPEAGKRILI